MSKPEDSGFDRKGKMFESEEDDDAGGTGANQDCSGQFRPLGDLQLSESEDESESDSLVGNER